MTCAVNCLIILGLAFNVFFMPGYGITRRYFRTTDPVELIAVSQALGLFGGSVLYFALSAILRIWLAPPLILIVANIVNLFHARIFIRDGRALFARKGLDGLEAPARSAGVTRLVLLGSVVTFLAFVARFDGESLSFQCVNYPVAYVTGVPMGNGCASNQRVNDILALPMEQREGNPAISAAMPGLFQYFGYRFFYGAQRLLLFLFAFLLGELYRGKSLDGAVLAILMTLHPTLTSLGEPDENLNVLVITVVMLFMLFRNQPMLMWAGFFFGIAFGCRHIILPGIIGLVFFALTQPRPIKSALALLTGFAMPCLLWSVHHALALGGVFREETQHNYTQLVPHQILGWNLNLPVIFQWPFVSELVRCPFNAFPQIILFPLSIMREHGAILCAFFLMGATLLFMEKRRLFLFLLFYMLPIFCIFTLLGNWMEADKVRMTLNLFGPLVFIVGWGITAVVRSPQRIYWIFGVAALSFLLSFGMQATEHFRFAVDEREYAIHPELPRETSEDYRIVRQEFEGWNILPYQSVSVPMLIFQSLKGASLAVYEACHRRYEDQTEKIPQKLSGFVTPNLHATFFRPCIRWKIAQSFTDPGKPGVALKMDLSRHPRDSCLFIKQISDPAPETMRMSAWEPSVTFKNKKVGFQEAPTDILLLHEKPGGIDDFILVVIVARAPDFYGEPPSPFLNNELLIEVPSQSYLMVMHVIASNPILILGWELKVGLDQHQAAEACPEVEKW